MKMGSRLMIGFGAGLALGVIVGGIAYVAAPPIQFPGQWSWLNTYGKLGVTFAAAWFAFVFTLVLTVFSMVASGFNETGGNL